MISRAFAEDFATDWIAAWNAHDLDRILSHYAEDFELTSPVIISIAEMPSGRLKGKATVAAYWEKALQQFPELHFGLIATLVGVNSMAIYYTGVSGPAAEVFHFDAAGKVIRSYAHYG